MLILKTGSLAYLDTTFSGLIPLKIVKIENDTRQDGKPVKHVVAKVTANRQGYYKGELITTESLGKIVPRQAVRKSRQRIFGHYILPYKIGN